MNYYFLRRFIMPYKLFYRLFPAIAEKETRTVIIPPNIISILPTDKYSFCEMFCDEPGCDCRRVMFSVASNQNNRILAVIAYGWETPEFYTNWLNDNDPNLLAETIGPILNTASQQSPFAPILLDLFKQKLLPDKAYIERVIKHYKMFRNRIEKIK
jgi:hypothetical protein